MPLDPTLELQSIRIQIHKRSYNITNIYIPPTDSTPPGYTPQLEHLNTFNNSLILGDFNAHDPTWLTTQQTDTRADTITTQLDTHIILNDPHTPTRKPFNIHTQPTSPDISFATPDITLRSSWNTLQELSSDHIPILITYRLHAPLNTHKQRHTYTNYKKAQWNEFTASVDNQLEHFDLNTFSSIDAATKHITDIITTANKHFIPTGNIRHYNPTFTPNIKHMIQIRKHLRSLTPTQDTITRIQQLNTDIEAEIKTQQCNVWQNTLNTINFRSDANKLWRLIRGLNNKYIDQPKTHESLTHNNTILTNSQQANALNKHYSNTSRLPTRPIDRKILRRLHRTCTDQLPSPPFTPAMVTEAIRATKNTPSTGPDGISNKHLKHLGPHAIRVFTDIFNYSLQHNSIPNTWKQAKIIPILKPNKPPTEPTSYRPISLLCTPSKILERLVLNNITPHIPLSPSQHGFRSEHSTSTLLTHLTQTTLEGLNTNKPASRTIIAAIDISKAFDTVPRHLLINKILNTPIHDSFKKWLANYLSGRSGKTIYNGKSSRTRHFTDGVPQGSVLSPTLFNLYLHDLPTPTNASVNTLTYADDVTIISQHHRHETAANNLQTYIHSLENWLETNRLKVSANKSSLTLITPYNVEYNTHPNITLNNTPLPINNTPKILGVTLDRGMTFKHHINDINNKAKNRLNVMRALTHTTYGHSKEDTTTLYKQFIRPILTYAHTAWSPDTANTHIHKLQRTQNAALRIATGCTRTTPTTHLHEETRVLPLASHMDMRGTHFYTSTLSPSHPLHYIQNERRTPRNIHTTPATYYRHLYTSLPDTPLNTSLQKHIHTTFTDRALSSFPPNSILGVRPPPIDFSEVHLSRRERVTLSRLRCGHHPSLPSYNHRIGRAVSDLCEYCSADSGTISHILTQCPTLQQHRTTHHIHTLEHLWTHPQEVSAFLRDIGFT